MVLDVGRLSLTGGGQILAATFGAGRGGDIVINAREAVTIDGVSIEDVRYPSGIFTSAASGSTGNAGNISLTTAHLTLTGGGQIATDTGGAGHGGALTITASEAVTIAGTAANNAPSGLFAGTEKGSTGDGGDLSLTTARLTLTGGGAISASTGGAGRGGTLTITASEAVTIDGIAPDGDPSGLYVTRYQRCHRQRRRYHPHHPQPDLEQWRRHFSPLQLHHRRQHHCQHRPSQTA